MQDDFGQGNSLGTVVSAWWLAKKGESGKVKAESELKARSDPYGLYFPL
jgi:hypothetical protein